MGIWITALITNFTDWGALKLVALKQYVSLYQ